MKNKILFLGSLCLILAFGLIVIGCEETVSNTLPEVALKVERVLGPDDAAKDSKSPVFIISWKAVEGAVEYMVYTQTQDRATSIFKVVEFAGTGGFNQPVESGNKWDPKQDPTSTMTSEDATASDWSVVVDFAQVIGASSIKDLGLGRVGVMAIPLRTEKDPSIVWAPYEDFDITWWN